MFSDPSFILTRRRAVSVACLLIFGLTLIGCAGMTTSKLPHDGLSVTPGSIDFKSVTVGQTLDQTLTISNTGKAPIHISSMALSNKEFSFTGPSVPRTILPGVSLSYAIAFSPTTSGSSTASLAIGDTLATAPISVSLAGTGEKVIGSAKVSPVSVNFGNTPLQITNAQNVTLENTSDVPLSISGVTVVGSGFGFSDLSPGYVLPASQKVNFQVWFRPTLKGATTGTVSILSANLASPAQLSLSGDGISSTITPTPSPTTPTAPTPVQHTVSLTWNASSSTVIGYRVYRSETSGGSYNTLTGSSLNALTYADSTVASGTTYYYVVTAVDAAGNESVYSNQATAVVPSP